MSDRAEYKNDQSPIRDALERNGYTWVPNNGKRTRGRNWTEKARQRIGKRNPSTIDWWDVAIYKDEDEESGELTKIHIANPSTGLFIEGDLYALDVDFEDVEICNLINDHADKVFGSYWSDYVLERFREGSEKFALLFRVSDPEHKDKLLPEGKLTLKFWPPGTPEEVINPPQGGKWTRADTARPQAVECFRTAGAEPRHQIGVYGWHTVPDPENGVEGIEYEWSDDRGPKNTHREDLPEVPYATFREFWVSLERVIEEAGWIKAITIAGINGNAPKAYDLNPDAVFVTVGGEEVDGHALDTDDTVRMKEITGEGTNPERGHCFRKPNGVLGVFDREHGLWHYPPSEDPARLEKRAEKLGKALQKIAAQEEDEVVETDDPDTDTETADEDPVFTRVIELLKGVNPSVEGDDLEDVLKQYERTTMKWDRDSDQIEARARVIALHWSYVEYPGAKHDSNRWQCLIPGKSPSLGTPAFMRAFPEVAMVKPSADPDSQAVAKPVPVTKLFSDSRLRVSIEGHAFLPGNPYKIALNEHGYHMINTYVPPQLGTAVPELIDLYEEFCEHMWDHQSELDIFHECMAYKFQDLTHPGVTHVMVADGVEGVGRNTLVTSMLFSALGDANCGTIPQNKLRTDGSQSQFNAWRADSLMLFIPELRGLPRSAMETMKEICEVQAVEFEASKKYGEDRKDKDRATKIIATNHLDAIPFDLRTENRRFQVHGQGSKGPLSGAPDNLAERINEIRLGEGVTSDMAASIHHFYTEKWNELNERKPHWSVFMNASATPTKERMVEASKKLSVRYIEDVLIGVEQEGFDYVEVGQVADAACDAAKRDGAPREVVSAIAGELNKLTTSGKGVLGWVRVYGPRGSDRIKVAGDRKKTVLARGQPLAETFQKMGLNQRLDSIGKVVKGVDRLRDAISG